MTWIITKHRQALVFTGVLMFIVLVWFFAPTNVITDDAYFYLVSSRRFVLEGSYSFSGLYPTNGVHPLWALLVTLYTWVVSLLDTSLLYHDAYAIPLSAAFLGLGTYYHIQNARRANLEPLLAAGIPLLFVSIFGVLYSEAHLLYCALGILIYVMQRNDNPYQLGLASAFVFYARLDMIFLLVALYGLHLLVYRRLGFLLRAGLLALLLALPYLTLNLVAFGGLTPISGWLKSSFPLISEKNTWDTGAQLWQVSFRKYFVLWGLVPLGFGAIALIRQRKRPDYILMALFFGSFLTALYTMLFTYGQTLWYWYYVLPMVLMGWTVARLVPQQIARRLGVTVLLLGMLFHLGNNTQPNPYSLSVYRLQQEFLATVPDDEPLTILVNDFPGALAFYTKHRIIAADMLTANRYFYDDMLAAEDAITFLFDYANDHQHPIDFIMAVEPSVPFLLADDTHTSLTYYAPSRDIEQSIGTLYVGEPIFQRNRLTIWHAPDS